jgi:hypothetical protein
VFVSGPLHKLEQARRALQELDVPQKGQAPIQIGPRDYKTYKVPTGNAEALIKALEEAYGKSPNAAYAAFGKDAITVHAFPADQAVIKKFIESFKGDDIVTERIDPNHELVVRGTREQIKAVRESLKKDVDSTTPADSERRMKRLEDKLDTLLREVEALRKERQSESPPADRKPKQ